MPFTKGGETMPRRDQTGPNGSGPMTGRAMGRCNNNIDSSSSFGYGRGNRRNGRGLNRGFQTYSLQEEKAYLEQQLARINDQIKDEE